MKVIVELQAKTGKRTEHKNQIESVVAKYGSGRSGFLGITSACLVRLSVL